MVTVGISSESRIRFGGCEFPQGFLVERQLEVVLHNKSPFTPSRCDENYRPVCEHDDKKKLEFQKRNGVIFRFVIAQSARLHARPEEFLNRQRALECGRHRFR